LKEKSSTPKNIWRHNTYDDNMLMTSRLVMKKAFYWSLL
jgi:hypothetical protein